MGGVGCKTRVPCLDRWCGALDRGLLHRCGARVRGLGTSWARAVLAGRAAACLASVFAIHL